MVRRLRPVGLDFVGTAPVRFVFSREMSAPPDAVFRAMAEDVPGWSEWFTGVTYARPVGDGTRREVRLKGGTRCLETIVAAEPSEVYAYRVDQTNAPGVSALLEEWRLAPAGAGTRVRWSWAADGSAAFRFALKLARPGLGRAFRDSVVALDRRLSAG